jgi:hypothetical protein
LLVGTVLLGFGWQGRQWVVLARLRSKCGGRGDLCWLEMRDGCSVDDGRVSGYLRACFGVVLIGVWGQVTGVQLGQAWLVLGLRRARKGKLLLLRWRLKRVDVSPEVLLGRILLHLELRDNIGVLVRG